MSWLFLGLLIFAIVLFLLLISQHTRLLQQNLVDFPRVRGETIFVTPRGEFNPSLLRDENDLIILARGSTETHCSDADTLRAVARNIYRFTENWWVEYRLNLTTGTVKKIRELRQPELSESADPRLYSSENEIGALYSYYNGGKFRIKRMILYREGKFVNEIESLKIPHDAPPQKNWNAFMDPEGRSVILTDPMDWHFVLNSNELPEISYNRKDVEKVLRNLNLGSLELRGSSPFVPFGDHQMIGILHVKNQGIVLHWIRSVIVVISEFAPYSIISHSPLVSFLDNSNRIEFVSGFAAGSGGCYYVSLGKSDCHGHVVRIKYEELSRHLTYRIKPL
jgi:hypothetical protein